MPDEPEKPAPFVPKEPDESDESEKGPPDEERPTVNPPFDPVAFAREVLRRPSDKHNAIHARTTPPRGTEEQRWRAAARKKTPASTLSLANARVPSNLPPIAAKVPSWKGQEQVTRPPPADGSDQDPDIEIAPDRPPPSLEFDDGRDEEADTVRRPIPDWLVPPTGSKRAQPLPPPAPEVKNPEERTAPPPTMKKKPSAPPKSDAVEMRDRVSLGDYSGALEVAEKILAGDPSHAEAKACANNCRAVLKQMYATRIGPLDRVPVVMVPRDQLRWLSIDHRAGFVLSLVDGVSNLEMIIDVSGMPELDTLRILSELAQQRIISLR